MWAMLPKKMMGAPDSMSEEAELPDQLLFIYSDRRVVFSLESEKNKSYVSSGRKEEHLGEDW